ncbi:MAG: hypothetical protein ABL903_10155 [Methylococcales bacterium]
MSTFDIFLKGVKPDRLDEADHIKLLASQYLQLDLSKLNSLLSAPSSSCFRRGVSEQEANELQINLSKIGLVCICKPGAALSNLSLTSIETKPTTGNIYICPNCSHPEPLAENQPPPEECSKCGIINKKLLEAQKLAAETAEIRNNILRSQKAKETLESKQREEEEAEKRKKNIEHQVLTEMQGSQKKKSINIKTFAAGAVSLILVGGIAYSVGRILNKPDAFPVQPEQQLASTPDKSPAAQGENNITNESQPASAEEELPPNQDTPPAEQEQSIALATESKATNEVESATTSSQAKMPEGAGTSMEDAHDKANKVLNSVGLDADAMGNNAGNGTTPAATSDITTNSTQNESPKNSLDLSKGESNSVSQSSIAPASNSDKNHSASPETITTSDSQALAIANSDTTNAPISPTDQNSSLNASLLTNGANNPEWDLFLSKGVANLVAKNAFTDAIRLGNHIVDIENYINTMGTALEVTQKAGKSKQANEILSTIVTKIEALPDDRHAQHFAQAGYYQMRATGSANLLERADKILATQPDPEVQLKSSLKIAVNYSKIGNNELANRYFNQINALLSKIESPDRKIIGHTTVARAYKDVGSQDTAYKWLISTDKLSSKVSGETLQELVGSYAYINQLQAALDLIKTDESSNVQNALIYNAINESLKSNLTQNASTLSKEIQDPIYKAMAYDQIANYLLPANNNLALAEKSLADIKNPADQAIISSLLARHYQRIANPQKAKALIQLTVGFAAKVPPSLKDDVVTIIARNLSRSLEIKSAKEQLASIQSESLKLQLNTEINKAAEVSSILKSI